MRARKNKYRKGNRVLSAFRENKNGYYILFFVVFAFILYGNTIPNKYAIDDPIVTNNPLIQKGFSAIPEIFTTRYRVHENYNYGYRPVVKSTFAVEYQLFGQNPFISHFINILIYAFTGVFLFLLLKKILKNYNVLFSFIITALFIAHPVHTEAVASLKNREELLSFLGCIVALYFFIRYTENKKIISVLLGLFFFLFAFLSKQNALTFTAVIPLTIYFFSDTPVGSKFLKPLLKSISILFTITGTILRNRKTILVSGLFFYYLTLVTWDYDYYLPAAISAVLTVILLVSYYLKNNPTKKTIVSTVIKSKYFITGLLFYIAAIAGKHFSYIDFTLNISLVTVLSLIAVTLFLSCYFKYFPVKKIKLSGFMNKYSLIILFLYLFPFFDELIILNIIAGIIPFIMYFLIKTSSKITDLLPQVKSISSPVKKINFLLIFKGIQAPVNTIFLLTIFLIIASCLGYYGPDQYLPSEERELYYFENPLFFESNLWLKIATGLYSLLIYFKLLVFPHPLLFYYGYNHIPVVEMTNIWVMVSMIFHIAMFIYAIITIRKKSIISYAILYYLITISMFSNIIIPIPGIVGERLLFMPSLGFCIALGYLIFRVLKLNPGDMQITRKTRSKIFIALIIILIPYSAKTIHRNKDWKDHLTLYLHDIPYLKNSLHANSLVASHLLRDINHNPTTNEELSRNKRKLDLVIGYFKQVLKLDPKETRTLNNLGTIYYDFFKQYEIAIPYFHKAIASDSTFALAYLNIAYCYEMTNKFDEAIKNYKMVMKVDPADIKPVSNLANLYNKLGNFDKAVSLNEKIMKIEPNSEVPYINIAQYYLQRSDEIKAVTFFEKAIEANPNNYELCMKLSSYYNENGNAEKAKYYYNKTIIAKKSLKN